MGTALNDLEFGEALRTFEHTAFRLELQRAYVEADEQATLAKFLAGEPEPPTEVLGLQAWYEQVAGQIQAGKRVERVRVHDHPPTDYQRWERWIGAWNITAGEVIRYMTRERAHEIGLLPVAGDCDWWLLDSNRLIIMRFDAEGHRLANELITDPQLVVQACAWRDLAVHHSSADQPSHAAA
jgi:hypothetical protein